MSFSTLIRQITRFKALSEEGRSALLGVVTQKTIAKGHFFAKGGKVCKELYFMEKGYARGYYELDGKEMTTWFAFENDLFTSFYSYISQKPAVENLVAMEECQVCQIRQEDLARLYKQFHEIESLGRLINEHYYVKLEERMNAKHFKTAKELYDLLLQDTPQLLQRVPLGHIASYLGMSQETLSRIRGKK